MQSTLMVSTNRKNARNTTRYHYHFSFSSPKFFTLYTLELLGHSSLPLLELPFKPVHILTSGQDGGIGRHTSPPCTTTERNYN